MKTMKETSKRCYICVKTTYDQYVEMFKENNPRIIQSINNYQNQKGEECGEDNEYNRDYTDESNESYDSTVDYNFNFQSTFQLSCV